MALKRRHQEATSEALYIDRSLMRYGVKLLIGVSLPGFAIAAFCLWTAYRARHRDGSHVNGCEVARDAGLHVVGDDKCLGSVQDRASTQEEPTRVCHANEAPSRRSSDLEEPKSIKERCTNEHNIATTTLDSNCHAEFRSGKSKCCDMDTVLPASNFVANDQNLSSEMDVNQAGVLEKLISEEKGGQFETRAEQNAHFPNPESDTEHFQPHYTDSRKKSEETNKSGNFNGDHPNDSSDAEYGRSTGTPGASCEMASSTKMKGEISSRAQSVDSYSDVSSVDGQGELPRDTNTRSNAGSDIENAPQQENSVEEDTWELEFPQALCGRLIGKKGKNVQNISQTTGTKIRLIPQKDNTESSQRLVSITGSRQQLQLALDALRKKFPSVPFTRLNGAQPYVETNQDYTAVPSIGYVTLPENELCHVFVTHILGAKHFFVQLYDNSFQGHLRHVEQEMYQFYGSAAAPMQPQAINTGMLCASLSASGWWWRAQVVGVLSSALDEVEITWLDYGGRATVPTSMLRQLRPEFQRLPCQAVECYLSNIVPNLGESSFSMVACAFFERVTQNVVLTARVTGYTRDCTNLELYASDQWTGQSVFVNREFVRMGFARWSET